MLENPINFFFGLILNKIIHISCKKLKKTDHILKMAGLGLFCDYRFKKVLVKFGCQMNAANYFKGQRRRSTLQSTNQLIKKFRFLSIFLSFLCSYFSIYLSVYLSIFPPPPTHYRPHCRDTILKCVL